MKDRDANRIIDTYLYGERSLAVRYGLTGAALVFLVLFPVATFLIGPAMGLPIPPGPAAMFALAAAATFGIVAGMVAGAAERGTPRRPQDGDAAETKPAPEPGTRTAA